MKLPDREFRDAFEALAVPAEAFRHRDHVHLAWVYVSTIGAEAALTRAADAIRAFTTHHNAAGKYHETITCAWVRLVAAAMRVTPGIDDFDVFVGQHPYLLDKSLLQRFYSTAALSEERARTTCVAPDLAPLP